MICNNCQTVNESDSKFCIKCGSKLENLQNTEVKNVMEVKQNNVAPMENTLKETSINNNIKPESTGKVNSETKKPNNYFDIVLDIFKNPNKAFTSDLDAYNNAKSSILFALIVSVVAIFLNFFNHIYHLVKTTDIYGKLTFDFDNLKQAGLLKYALSGFFEYLLIIFAIAGIAFITMNFIKKEAKFGRLLAIASVVVIPLVASSYIIEPLFDLANYTLSGLIGSVITIYAYILLYEGFNKEFVLEPEKRININIICFTAIMAARVLISIIL